MLDVLVESMMESARIIRRKGAKAWDVRERLVVLGSVLLVIVMAGLLIALLVYVTVTKSN